MNNTLTGEEPSDAIKLESIELRGKKYKRTIGFDEKLLPDFVQVRFLYRYGELEGGEKIRATDPIWSLKIYDLKKSVISKDEPVLYHLENGPR